MGETMTESDEQARHLAATITRDVLAAGEGQKPPIVLQAMTLALAHVTMNLFVPDGWPVAFRLAARDMLDAAQRAELAMAKIEGEAN